MGLVVHSGTAYAACHAFDISVSPSSVSEGATLTVTVTRDGAVMPSSVDVRSVDGTARAGSDFPAVRRTVAFTSEVQKSFTVAITDDKAAEGSEAFRMELVQGSATGCEINTNFSYGPPASVTIKPSDQPAATRQPQPSTNPPSTRTPQPPRETPTAPGGTSPARTLAPTGAVTNSPLPQGLPAPDPTATEFAADGTGSGYGDGGGTSGVVIVLVIVLIALATGGAAALVQRMRGRRA
jgi:hypothetical protein